MSRAGLILALFQLAAAPAFAGDAAHGGVIAKRWCADCHVVSSDQKSARADAPPFADVATRRPDDKALAAFLADPHPKMPDMNLTRKEIDDIVAYIRTLAPGSSAPARPEAEPERPTHG